MITHAAQPDQSPMMEMNTTPLIDVLLVLLVMLIITIPLQTHSMKLDLPGPGPVPKVQPTRNLLEITSAGAMLWNGQPITRDALRYDLRQSQRMKEIPELHFRPAAEARYAVVAEALGIIESENVRKVGFVGNEAYARW